MAGPTETYLTTGEVARGLQVSRKTVTRWCTAGLVPGAWKTPGPRGSWRVPESAVKGILHEWELQISWRPPDRQQTQEEG
jgi:excisionase family DNA binding protein